MAPVTCLYLPSFQTIEASLSTPEKMSSGLAEMMKRSDANPESLERPLRDLLKKNGVTPEGLEKVIHLLSFLICLLFGHVRDHSYH